MEELLTQYGLVAMVVALEASLRYQVVRVIIPIKDSTYSDPNCNSEYLQSRVLSTLCKSWSKLLRPQGWSFAPLTLEQ